MVTVYHLVIPRSYHQLLPYVFKRFSVLRAGRTLLPTVAHYLARTPLPPSDKPALFTMNILPPMMTVWYHCARKYLKEEADITIFDCSGSLHPHDFPGARVQKFLNLYAATKADEFFYHIARHRRVAWMCDDDVFFIGHEPIKILEREFTNAKTASVSLRPRTWWHFSIDGKNHPVSSSYCTAVNREIYCEREHLSLAPAPGNTHPSDIGKPPKRYDTFDRANEILLAKGYRCYVATPEEQERSIAAFSGLSGAVMLLWYFKTPDQTLDYFRSPPKEQWTGSLLYGVFSAMLSILTIQECYATITGKPYPLPSLPSRTDLEKIRREREPILGGGRSFRWVDEASEHLRRAL